MSKIFIEKRILGESSHQSVWTIFHLHCQPTGFSLSVFALVQHMKILLYYACTKWDAAMYKLQISCFLGIRKEWMTGFQRKCLRFFAKTVYKYWLLKSSFELNECKVKDWEFMYLLRQHRLELLPNCKWSQSKYQYYAPIIETCSY